MPKFVGEDTPQTLTNKEIDGANNDISEAAPAEHTHESADITDLAPGGGGQMLVTKVVAPSGGDYTTLSDAIAAASNDWVIRVMPGTYTEAGVTSSLTGLTIEGCGWKNTVLNFSTNSLTLSGAGITCKGVQLNFTTGTCTFSGADALIDAIQWNKTAATNDGFVIGGVRTVLTNSQIISTNTTPGTASVFRVQNASGSAPNAFVSNNYFKADATNTTNGAFHFYGACKIVGNKFDQAGGSNNVFIKLQGGYNVFTGNIVEDTWGSNTAVILNVLETSNVITDNQFNTWQGTAATIQLYENTRSVVSGNTLTEGCKNGIKITGGAVANSTRNNITDNTIVGYTAGSSNGVSVSGNYNIVANNNIDAFATGINILSGSTSNNVVGNLAHGSSTNYTDSGTTTNATGNITA